MPVSYRIENGRQWISNNQSNKQLLHLTETINRTDRKHLAAKDSIIVATDSSGDIAFYMPFPLALRAADTIDKIIFFSYTAQAFGAYENGELVYTGATNMGRQKDPTPIGLFFTNWKAEKTTSTFNDEWELQWNFNIENKLGVGWHQYEMPGYPASHSCLRLLETDARYLYNWADQWVLNGNDEIKKKGTPVIVFGSYDFSSPAPWKQLIGNPNALNISEAQLETELNKYNGRITR